MMVWGFTGTRRGRPDFAAIMDAVLANADCPEFVIVGDCPYGGVDKQVEDWCAYQRIDCRVEPIDPDMPSPGCFYDRNQRIADTLSVYKPNAILWAFPDARARGTWDCVRRAKRLGVHVEVR
jgi:hypothetical protein